MDRVTLSAVAAAKLAIEDAKLDINEKAKHHALPARAGN